MLVADFQSRRKDGGPVIRVFRTAAVLSLLLLGACGDQSSSSSTVVTGFTVTPGDGEVTLSWDSRPGQIYAAYYKVGSSVTVADYDNLLVPVTSPYVVSNLTNSTQYAFILTATNEGSTAGPPTPVVTTVPGTGSQGIAWTIGTPLQTSTSAALRSIAYGDGNFVAVGTGADVFGSNASNSNTGGLSPWTRATTLPSGFGDDLSSVIYDGARFVALGLNGSIIISTDTLVWTAGMPIAGGKGMNAIAYGNNTYVAVGFGGVIVSNNSDLSSGAWTLQSSGTNLDLYGVAFVNGVFIAVGSQGTLLTSSDGVTWTPRNSTTTENLWQVAFGANTYIVVGDSGTILSSSDSATWQQVALGTTTTQSFYAVCFATNAQFVAVGDAGIVAYSTTGASDTWTVSTVGDKDLYGVTSGGVVVAVGAIGANVSGN
jgi:Photosynthesis system II assembly factor YCF48